MTISIQRKDTFTSHGVKKVNTSKCAGNNGPDPVPDARDANLGVPANVGEDISLAEFDES